MRPRASRPLPSFDWLSMVGIDVSLLLLLLLLLLLALHARVSWIQFEDETLVGRACVREGDLLQVSRARLRATAETVRGRKCTGGVRVW